MDFEINNEEWKIKLMDKNTILYKYNEEYEDEASFVFGLTLYPEHEIWINKDMCKAQQLKTLWHELTHCYIWSFGLKNVPHFTEEMVCDIVSSAHTIIENIIIDFISNDVNLQKNYKNA